MPRIPGWSETLCGLGQLHASGNHLSCCSLSFTGISLHAPLAHHFCVVFLKGRCFTFDKVQFAKFSSGSKKSLTPREISPSSVLSLRTFLWLGPNPFQVYYYMQVKIKVRIDLFPYNIDRYSASFIELSH